MELNKLKKIFVKNKNFSLILIYFLTYLGALFSLRKGIGNYWDWNFPYFAEHIQNFFLNKSFAWTDIGLGSPLGYSSDYFLRLFLSIFKINPEILLFSFLLIIFSVGSYFVYLLCKNKTNQPISFLLGLLAFLNPAIFYKILAGHLNYIFSYFMFIILIYFAIKIYDNSLKNTVVLGLLFAFVGSQIQFFIFSIIFLILFAIIKKKINIRNFSLIIIITLLLNLFWLSNFVFGVLDLQETSNIASGGSFKDSMSSSVLNILNFNFSKASLISRIYPSTFLNYFSLIFILVPLSLLINKKNKNLLVYASSLIIYFFLGAGYLNYLNIKPINIFLPIFREVAHLAPLIILFSLFIISAFKFKNKKIKILFTIYLIIFLLLNISIYSNNLPEMDFGSARDKFSEFNDFKEDSINRVMAYPFFSHYSFIDSETKLDKNGFMLSNSGSDRFVEYSKNGFINNRVFSSEFNKSVQYNFLTEKEYSLDYLRKFNIKYIYDLSGIYESNIEKYITSSTYGNDISIIKNDPSFIDRIYDSNNFSEISKISENILSIKNSPPRVSSEGIKFIKINPSKYKIHFEKIEKKQNINFLESYHKDWKLYLKKDPMNNWCEPIEFYENSNTTECKHELKFIEGEELSYLYKKSIANETHKIIYDYANQWTIDPNYIKENYPSNYYIKNNDGSIDIELVLYFRPQSYFYLGLIISGATLFSCVGYLIYHSRRNKKPKKNEEKN
jgi:hypothetical protein